MGLNSGKENKDATINPMTGHEWSPDVMKFAQVEDRIKKLRGDMYGVMNTKR
jgi:hypothetical protein